MSVRGATDEDAGPRGGAQEGGRSDTGRHAEDNFLLLVEQIVWGEDRSVFARLRLRGALEVMRAALNLADRNSNIRIPPPLRCVAAVYNCLCRTMIITKCSVLHKSREMRGKRN